MLKNLSQALPHSFGGKNLQCEKLQDSETNKQTSARLVLLAPLPPFPYRPREIFRPSTKYVRIRPFPFTCNVVMDINIWGNEKTYIQNDWEP